MTDEETELRAATEADRARDERRERAPYYPARVRQMPGEEEQGSFGFDPDERRDGERAGDFKPFYED